VQQLLMIQALGFTGDATTFNGPSWSISTEFYTYLVFGAAVLALTPKTFGRVAPSTPAQRPFVMPSFTVNPNQPPAGPALRWTWCIWPSHAGRCRGSKQGGFGFHPT
jgi:peptidoglycan/LPS O-acetylase OafA/YrhL